MKFIKPSKKIYFITFIIIFLAIVLVFTYSNKTQTHTLENLSYLAAIITLIFVSFQIRLAIKDYRITNERLRKEKAVELAKYYEETILPLTSKISFIFDCIDMDKKLYSSMRENEMIDFDYEELTSIGSDKMLDEYKVLINSDDCKKAYVQYCLLNGEESDSKINIKLEVDEGLELLLDEKEIDKAVRTTVNHLFDIKSTASLHNSLIDLLNKLEFFAMNFNYNIADESVVYQSLHQSYRGIVKLLYIQISSVNKDPKYKYFTNTIELFNTWNNRYLEFIKEEKNNKSKSIYKGKKLEA